VGLLEGGHQRSPLRCVASDCSPLGVPCVRAWVCVCVCVFLFAGNSRVHDERRESLWSSSEMFFQVLLSTHWRYTPGCGSDGSDGGE
jgi:hypothetical protein